MASADLPRGLMLDLITPLTKGGSIDGRGLGRHLDKILPYVQGVLIANPHFEEKTILGPDQRDELLDKCMVIIQGRLPLFVWITGKDEKSTRETLALLKKRLESRKYSGPVFWVDTPLYYHSNRGLIEYCNEITGSVVEPFVLFNDPDLVNTTGKSFKRSNIRTAILKELVRNEKIAGLIFSGSLDRSYNYNRAVRFRSDFRIYDGDESRFLDHPGLNGIFSTGANLAPRAWNRIAASSIRQGDGVAYPDQLQQMWDTWRYLNDLKNIYEQKGSSAIKKALSLMGIIEEYDNSDSTVTEAAEAILNIMKNQGDYA